VLVEGLISMFRTASIDEMIDEYVNAYRLPPGLLERTSISTPNQAETGSCGTPSSWHHCLGCLDVSGLCRPRSRQFP
jgi:hypothetical protein